MSFVENAKSDERTRLVAAEAQDADVPLVVDVDGTLIRSDFLIESFFSTLTSKPMAALAVWRLPLRGKAWLKGHLADHAVLDVTALPLDETVLDYIRQEKARGRAVYLASAADQRLVRALADHLGLFDGTLGSDGTRNLSGRHKAEALVERFGEKGFDYIGNDWVDLAVWRHSRRALGVNLPARLARALKGEGGEVLSSAAFRLKVYVKALRLHQWLKNLLVFVPMLSSHRLNLPTFGWSLLAMLSFSLAASSAYLLNDLLDLANDRAHATKRRRPLASGALPLTRGILLFPVLLGLSVLGAISVSPAFLGVMSIYYVVTVAYSMVLKRQMLIDVLTLAGLYTLRILAGSTAIHQPTSAWLMGFSVFIFLCLAIIKRYIELIGQLKKNGDAPKGRGYRVEDLSVLSGLAAASGYCSVLILALYFNSPDVRGLYHHPSLLWFTCAPLLYWVSRMLVLAHRGELHEDPVVFAATDKVSLVTGAVMLAIVLASV